LFNHAIAGGIASETLSKPVTAVPSVAEMHDMTVDMIMTKIK
jgi:hypothetical protein